VRRGGEGFTLLELLIAMAVLTIGLLALWGLHSAAITSNANAYRLGVSTILAQDALEQLYGETYIATSLYTNSDLDVTTCGGAFPAVTIDGLEDLPCQIDTGGFRVNGLGNTDATLGPVMYLRTYHLEDVSGSVHSRILMRVRVTYEDPHTGKRHGVTMGGTRMVDSYDPQNLG
jgi:prepilin-type N-terminal cleavage/methylation domain-containing protein